MIIKVILHDSLPVQNIDPQYDFNSISQFELEDMIYDSRHSYNSSSSFTCAIHFDNIDQDEMEPIFESNPTLYAIPHLRLHI